MQSPVPAASVLRWSDHASWEKLGVEKPRQGAVVTIPAGTVLLLDESPPPLEGIFVDGALHFDERDLALFADYIVVNGLFQVGDPDRPFRHRLSITLTGDYTDQDQSIGHCGTKVLCAQGGRLDIPR